MPDSACERIDFQFALGPGTDSLPTNLAVAALEQESFASDPGTLLISSFCCHHQSVLAKKPIILSFPGLASGALVRVMKYINSHAACIIAVRHAFCGQYFTTPLTPHCGSILQCRIGPSRPFCPSFILQTTA